MGAICAALQPADNDSALGEIDIRPAKVTGFGNPQAVAIDEQGNKPIPLAMPVEPEGGQQLTDLDLCQMLADPIRTVPPASFERTGRITLFFRPAGAARFSLTF